MLVSWPQATGGKGQEEVGFHRPPCRFGIHSPPESPFLTNAHNVQKRRRVYLHNRHVQGGLGKIFCLARPGG